MLAPSAPVVNYTLASGTRKGDRLPLLSRGASGYAASLRWTPSAAADVARYAVTLRATTAADWEREIAVGNVASHTIEDSFIDDAIIGVKGRYTFGESRKWSVPFYLDVGTGQSDLTWQAAVGVGYAFQWGEVSALWRYLDYKFKSSSKIEDMNFNGPQIGLTFRW